MPYWDNLLDLEPDFRTEMRNNLCPHLEVLKDRGGLEAFQNVILEEKRIRKCPCNRHDADSETDSDENDEPPTNINSLGYNRIFACLQCTLIGCRGFLLHHRKNFLGRGHDVACELIYGTLYCFACSDFVFDESFESILESVSMEKGSMRIKTGGQSLKIKELLWLQSSSVFGLNGLLNLGNTCYMNSVIQVLVSTPNLVEFFLGEKIPCNEEHERGKPCMMKDMFKLFEMFYTREKNEDCGSILDLSEFLEAVNLNMCHIAGSDQQDAHEFFLAILETLGRHYPFRFKQPTPIENIFQGTLTSTLRCKVCGTGSTCKEPFLNLSLEVFGSSDITLDECLQRYTQVEDLDPRNKFMCKKCEKEQPTSKQLQLETSPLVLSLHFKRFYNLNARKWKYHVKFPLIFNLSEFMLNKIESESSMAWMDKLLQMALSDEYSYTLYGVIVHSGTTSGGHYYAYILRPPDIWVKCNDHTLTVVSTQEVLESEAYMLFYHRTNLSNPAFLRLAESVAAKKKLNREAN